ncbi:MAG: hypothetical protein R2827_13345 [Bdellovibrionales bacterium]
MNANKPFKAVNWSSGWIPFLLGLMTCFFWGGAVRVVFSDYQLSQWLNKHLQNHSDQWILEVEEPRLMLSRGAGIPAFGLQVQLARVIPKDTCEEQNGLQLVQTYIPVALIQSLMQKKVVFHQIEVAQATLLTFDGDCGDQKIELEKEIKEVAESETNTVKDTYNFKSVENALLAYNKNLPRIQELPLKNVYFKEFWWQRKNRIMILRNLSVQRAEHLTIKANADLSRWKSGLSEFKSLPIEVSFYEDHLKLELDGAVREGKINVSFVYDPQKTKPVSLEVVLDDFPLTQLLRIMEKPSQPSLSSLWLNCNVSAEALVSSAVVETNIKSCQLIESEGKIELGEMAFEWPYMQSPQLKSEGIIFVHQWPIETLLKILQREGPSGVFKDFGKLSGEIQVASADKINFRWSIEDSAAVFSRANQKTYQKLSLVAGELDYRDRRISGIINEATLDRGEFVGKLSFNLDDQFSNGVLQVAIEHLKFHPTVQKVMVDGVLGSMGIFGQAAIDQSSIARWRGSFAVGKIFGKDWGIKQAKIKSLYDGKNFQANTQLDELTLSKEHLFHPWMETLFESNKKESWILSPVRFDFKLVENGVEWKNLTANFGVKSLNSFGNWKEGKLFGQIRRKGSAKKYMLLGESNEWFLKDDKSNLIPIFANSGVLPTVKAIEPIKNLGQKVLESAKKIIPKENQ